MWAMRERRFSIISTRNTTAQNCRCALKIRIASDIRKSSLQTILDGLNWLGVEFDGEPVFQSHRAQAHKRAAERLLATGHAYYGYETPEELAAMQKQAQAEKRRVRYNRDLTPEQQAAYEAEGRPRGRAV